MIDSIQMILSVYDNSYTEGNPTEEEHRLIRLFETIRNGEEFDRSLKNKRGRRSHPYVFNRYKDKSVQFWTLPSGYIFLKFHPYRLINQYDRVTNYTSKDEQAFIAGMNEILDELDAPHIEKSYWQVNRIDYCVNIPTPYKQLYLDLLNKGRTKVYQKRTRFDGKSCYFRGKGCTFNIYDKQDQLTKKGIEGQNLALAEDILRVELQCRNDKTRAIMKSYGWHDRNIMHFLQPSVAIGVLLDTAKHFYTGDYRTADKSKKGNVYDCINNATRLQSKTKETMIRIVSELATYPTKNLDDVREELKTDGLKDTEYYPIMSRFNKLNVNPVPIPIRQAKLYNIRHLDSLYALMNEYLETAEL